MGVFINTTVVDPFLDWLTGQTNMAAAATRYITTFDGNPQSGGSENISTITGSANRQDMTTAMAAASGGAIASDTDITFTTNAAAGATVDYVAVYDAITGGNLMASAQVTTKVVSIGDGLKILAGALTFSVS